MKLINFIIFFFLKTYLRQTQMEINHATSFHPETFQFTNSAACSPGQYNFTDDVYALA